MGNKLVYYRRVRLRLDQTTPEEFSRYLQENFERVQNEKLGNPYFATIVDDSCEKFSGLKQRLMNSGFVRNVEEI